MSSNQKNFAYIKSKLSDKLSPTTKNFLEAILSYGYQVGDEVLYIYPSNATIAKKMGGVSTDTVMRQKNITESLGITERYYDPIKMKNMMKVSLTILAEYQTEPLKDKKSIYKSATENTAKHIQTEYKSESESTARCGKLGNESAAKCDTNQIITEYKTNNNNYDYVEKVLKEACKESNGRVTFTPELVNYVKSMMDRLPSWASDSRHVLNSMKNKIMDGKFSMPLSEEDKKRNTHIITLIANGKADNSNGRWLELQDEYSYAKDALVEADIYFCIMGTKEFFPGKAYLAKRSNRDAYALKEGT